MLNPAGNIGQAACFLSCIMNKHRIPALILFILIISTARAFAAQLLNSFTYTVSVSFMDTLPPEITHVGIERISSVTKYAVFKATAADNIGLKSMSLVYYCGGDLNYSSKTVVLNGETSYLFLERMTLNGKNTYDFYYQFIADDAYGGCITWPASGGFQQVKVNPSRSKKLDAKGGKLILSDGNPEDGESSLEIPEGALDGETEITLCEIDPESEEVPPAGPPALCRRPLAIFRCEPSGLVFKKMPRINLLFSDFNKDGLVDGTSFETGALAVMWWDGFEWRVLGTKVDRELNLASANIKHFSYYAVFPAAALTDDDYRPKERIITPASVDGYNDLATFGAVSGEDIINIFDVTGQKIRQIKGDITWDGRDENNEMVESGIYIYQIKLKDKVISGTVVVAK